MRSLIFQQIVDSRWGEESSLLLERIEAIKRGLAPYQENVELRISKPREVIWPSPEPSIQWRADFQIRKWGRDPTWDRIMTIINRIKPPHYSWQ